VITELTRRDLVDLFNEYSPDPSMDAMAAFGAVVGHRRGIDWCGRLDEVAFLARLYDLDSLGSTDPRFKTAREDIRQHRINNLDWPDDWIFDDDRFELGESDEKLLAFLAETLHPAVRSNADEVEWLRAAYNRLLRRDRCEIHQTGLISGRPVFSSGPAVARSVQPDTLRHEIGQAIRRALNAGAVRAFCDELRMPPLPSRSYADPMASKAGYVVERLENVEMGDLVGYARSVLDRHRDEGLADLLFEIALARSAGVAGTPKNLIFAADGPKPDLVLVDSVNNEIQIVRNAEYCLIYDQPIDANRGLTFQAFVDWWAARQDLDDSKIAANELYERLKRGLNAPEVALLNGYKRLLQRHGFRLPALVPQVYLHYDPKSLRERLAADGKKLERQRMDFLLLLPGQQRVVVELDGVQHYADDDIADPQRYAAMVREDRRLRLAGYEVYRFGGHEFVDLEAGKTLSESFFTQLLSRYGVLA